MLRFLRTVRHLKAKQVFWRLYRRTRRIALEPPSAQRRQRAGDWTRPIHRASGFVGPTQLRLLNTVIDVGGSTCWSDPGLNRLMLYNLHYLGELNAAPGADDDAARAALLARWIADNPPPRGVGWEPYPLSLRISNIVKWLLDRDDADAAVLDSLHRQAQALSQQVEYHILGNHLFENAEALFLAGCFFADRHAERWLSQSRRILSAEIDEQILPDGGHFERSPMYQAIVLEGILDLLNASRAYGVALPGDVPAVARKMLAWLAAMTHGDGEVAYFNDATAGASPTLAELGEYSGRLGLGDGGAAPAAAWLRDSGYVRRTVGDVVILIDVGEIGPDYQPGHAHCDCLSFEIARGAERILVNAGVSTYEAGQRRDLERSTHSHNTVSVDGAEQIEFWGGFRVGRRAYPEQVEVDAARVSAAHSGFRHLGFVHRRAFTFSGRSVTIDDTVEDAAGGSRAADAPATAYFHFHPDVEPVVRGARVEFAGGSLSFDGCDDVVATTYDYCLGFNLRQQATMLSVTFRQRLRTEIDSTTAGAPA